MAAAMAEDFDTMGEEQLRSLLVERTAMIAQLNAEKVAQAQAAQAQIAAAVQAPAAQLAAATPSKGKRSGGPPPTYQSPPAKRIRTQQQSPFNVKFSLSKS